ncbi:MAG: UDP-N-acetylmuramoyl-L-alanyl-D-glutamate--2,6-diaminopimelate ligase [Bacteroidota bacterium]
MHYQNLIQDLSPLAVHGEAGDLWIEGISFDSREVEDNFLFVAIKGTRVDGHDYIEASSSKAAVIIGEQAADQFSLAPNTVYIQVQHAAEALGLLANRWFGQPSRRMKLVGITGTNGKTTVATLLHDLFTDLGYKAGLLSTVEVRIGQEVIPTTHTTPDALAINAHLAKMRDAGLDYVFMEVSSHAVDQRRIAGLQFTGAVFTNMSHDHLDYHGSFKAYIEAKKKFFDDLPKSAFALVNVDDKRGEVMLQNTRAQKNRYSLRSLVDYRARILDNAPQGLHLSINNKEVFTQFLGRFNAYNLLAAYGTAMLLNQAELDVLTVLSRLKAAAGRLDYITDDVSGKTAVVDYAHTPDALKNALETLRAVIPTGHQLICVVGAGGDRDRTKRPEMARIGAELSDRLILTSDNPRSESPEVILDEMEQGLSIADRSKTLRITDRRSAIRTAVSLAARGDLILVAGKGHEKYQEIRGEKHPFDDKAELRQAFNHQLN